MKRFVVSALILLLIAGSGLPYVRSTVKPQVTPAKTITRNLPTPERMLALVNAERAKAGVAPLSIDQTLNGSAQTKADDMRSNNYFAHSDKNGKHGYEYAHEANPKCKSVSENITDNIHTNDSETAVMAWIKSPKHYAAMISSKYDFTGFGVSGTKVVEHFCDM